MIKIYCRFKSDAYYVMDYFDKLRVEEITWDAGIDVFMGMNPQHRSDDVSKKLYPEMSIASNEIEHH